MSSEFRREHCLCKDFNVSRGGGVPLQGERSRGVRRISGQTV